MTSNDFVNSVAFKKRIDQIIQSATEDPDEKVLHGLIATALMDSFNDGIIANMTEKTKVSKETLMKKSKEMTGFLPEHFKNTDTGKKLIELFMHELFNNTTDYTINIGYEETLPACIEKILRIAYSIGITTGFEIASDKELKSIYSSNVERFLNSGKVGED